MTQRYLLRHSPFTSSDKTSSLSRCRYAALSPVRSVSSALMSGLVPVILLWSGASPDSLFSLYPRGAWPPISFLPLSLSHPPCFFYYCREKCPKPVTSWSLFLTSPLWKISMPLQSFLSAIQNTIHKEQHFVHNLEEARTVWTMPKYRVHERRG